MYQRTMLVLTHVSAAFHANGGFASLTIQPIRDICWYVVRNVEDGH